MNRRICDTDTEPLSYDLFKFAIYIFDSELVLRMQLMIIKVEILCCVCREVLTSNAY